MYYEIAQDIRRCSLFFSFKIRHLKKMFYDFLITADIQYYVGFRCRVQWLDIYVTYGDSPIRLVPTWHHT